MEMVPADRDVGRHEIRDGRISSAEHHVLGRAREVVVLDQERTGRVPAHDRLAVLRVGVAVVQVGIDHRRTRSVELDAAFRDALRVAVNPHAVEDDVGRDLGCRVVAPAEPDDA